MKIRHILPPEGAIAVYAIPAFPYVREVPLLNWALVTRRHASVNDAGEEVVESVDELVGLVVSGTVVAADEVTDGSVFGGYSHPNRYDDLTYKQIQKQLEEYGFKLEQYLSSGTEADGSAVGPI